MRLELGQELALTQIDRLGARIGLRANGLTYLIAGGSSLVEPGVERGQLGGPARESLVRRTAAPLLGREPFPLPTMRINPDVKDLFGFRYEDFELTGYEPHAHIKAPVAV